MKTLVLLLAAACGSSQTMTMGPDAGATPEPKGMPVGAPTTQMIDSAGGTVTSADGRLDVTIPAGAFSAPTAVTIQPITNTVPNGLGLGYRLSPEGMTFASPATLTFHLDAVQAGAIDSTFIASQQDDGTWWSQPQQTRGAQTISVPAPHFSDWSIAQTLHITPQQAQVRTSATAMFTAYILIPPDGDNALLASPLTGLPVPDSVPLDEVPVTRAWQVNGKNGGDTTVGQINDGMFTAPVNKPSPATVTVSVSAQLAKSKVIATGQAEITALETWNGSADMTGAGGTVIHANFVFEEDPAQSTGTMVKLVVKSGSVMATPPPPAGCTQTVSPDTHDLMPQEGMMQATYDLSTGPDNPHVRGQGGAVWAATYTVTCSNGTSSGQFAVSADWWPLQTNGMPFALDASNGVVDAMLSSAGTSGHLHLVRQP